MTYVGGKWPFWLPPAKMGALIRSQVREWAAIIARQRGGQRDGGGHRPVLTVANWTTFAAHLVRVVAGGRRATHWLASDLAALNTAPRFVWRLQFRFRSAASEGAGPRGRRAAGCLGLVFEFELEERDRWPAAGRQLPRGAFLGSWPDCSWSGAAGNQAESRGGSPRRAGTSPIKLA